MATIKKPRQNSVVYGLDKPLILTNDLPIIQPAAPNNANEAKIGTWWIDELSNNVYIKGLSAWVDLPDGPGSGNFEDLTLIGNGTVLDIVSGSMVLGMGDLYFESNLVGNNVAGALGDFLSVDVETLLVTTSLNFVSGFDSLLITDSLGNIDLSEGNGANGQVVIAGTGLQPIWTSFTSNQGSISFAPAANALSIDITDNAITTQIDAQSGSATPTGDLIEVIGGTNLETAAIGRVVSLRLSDSVTLTGFMDAGTLACGGALTCGTDLSVTTGDFEIDAGNFAITAAATNGINISTDPFVRTSGLGTITLVGRHSALSVTGGNNTIIGSDADRNLTTGQHNVLIGGGGTLASSGTNNAVLIYTGTKTYTVGSGAICIARDTGASANVTLNSNTILIAAHNIIGNLSNGSVCIESVTTTNDNTLCLRSSSTTANRLHIGRHAGINNHTACYFGGGSTVYGASVGMTNAAMLIDNNGIAGTTVSSRRFKDNIKDMGSQSALILHLRPVTFYYKKDKVKTRQYGLIAEEVDRQFPYLVNYDQEGKPLSVRYHELPVMILNELQNVNQRIAALERRYN